MCMQAIRFSNINKNKEIDAVNAQKYTEKSTQKYAESVQKDYMEIYT